MAYTIYSSVLSGLDASPQVRPDAGAGAPARLNAQVGTVLVPTATATTSTAAAVRIPSNAMVKSVMLALDAAAATFDVDIGLYYSDGQNDGTSVINQGTVISATLFASAFVAGSVVEWQEVAFQAATFLPSMTSEPIWKAAGLASDPGGMFDVVLTIVTGATSGAANASVKVEYDGYGA